ncbi:PIN domain nuclease [Kitasatospora sp. NPDC052896]|uniref:PIN domain nuclease n=1 Tax=Kitasatospora sp. NPDC052896 TaxID=3364061 RepID=UPI0037C97A22
MFIVGTGLPRAERGDPAGLGSGPRHQYAWDQAAAAGLIATCPITELEFFHSARTAADRARGIEDVRPLFSWVPVDDRAYDRAWQVQDVLTKRGLHRSAGAVDLVVAATAELQGLALLHRDHDFECVAGVTGQALQWYGPEAGK